MKITESDYSNVTSIDVQLARIYYPILIDLAKHKHCITYSELIERAKEENPHSEAAQNAIPVSTGRRLDVIRIFTKERELPALTSLIIGKNSGECGVGFTKHEEPNSARETVYQFNWESVNLDFDGFVVSTETYITPRKKITKHDAKILMSEYYRNNKSALPVDIRNHRDWIIELISEGISVEDAFQQVITSEAAA